MEAYEDPRSVARLDGGAGKQAGRQAAKGTRCKEGGDRNPAEVARIRGEPPARCGAQLPDLSRLGAGGGPPQTGGGMPNMGGMGGMPNAGSGAYQQAQQGFGGAPDDSGPPKTIMLQDTEGIISLAKQQGASGAMQAAQAGPVGSPTSEVDLDEDEGAAACRGRACRKLLTWRSLEILGDHSRRLRRILDLEGALPCRELPGLMAAQRPTWERSNAARKPLVELL